MGMRIYNCHFCEGNFLTIEHWNKKLWIILLFGRFLEILPDKYFNIVPMPRRNPLNDGQFVGNNFLIKFVLTECCSCKILEVRNNARQLWMYLSQTKWVNLGQHLHKCFMKTRRHDASCTSMTQNKIYYFDNWWNLETNLVV